MALMPRSAAQARHPKGLVELWVDELLFVFEQTERKYRRSLDRGAPREEIFRRLLKEFLPRRVGVAAGHVISYGPAWSQQCDVIVYNAAETPVFSHDDGHQGHVLPVEGVFGVVEVKSVLGVSEFKDAAAKIAAFKRLCAAVKVGAHTLADRFGAVVAYRLPKGSTKEREAHIGRLLSIAEGMPEGERPDDILVLGERRRVGITGSYLIARVPQGSPDGPLGYTVLQLGYRNLPIFLLHLMDERLRRIRTGMPDAHFRYFLEDGTDLRASGDRDERAERNIGSSPMHEATARALQTKSRMKMCPSCESKAFSVHEDAYFLVAAKDFHFGRLGAPYLPVAAVECVNCGLLLLHSAKTLGLTP